MTKKKNNLEIKKTIEELADQFSDFIIDIENEKEQLDFKVDAELRKRGWEHSSGHPGSLWLWTKTFKGKKYSVPKQTAIHMEKNLWAWK